MVAPQQLLVRPVCLALPLLLISLPRLLVRTLAVHLWPLTGRTVLPLRQAMLVVQFLAMLRIKCAQGSRTIPTLAMVTLLAVARPDPRLCGALRRQALLSQR